MNATWVDVVLDDGTEFEAHWSEDMSGEFQPQYAGWFIRRIETSPPFMTIGFQEIQDPVGWKLMKDAI